MLKFISFGSGSSGNCYYLYSNGVGILIDVGIGVRALKHYFSNYGLSLQEIKAILITHDHADHVKSVGALSAALRLPVYALENCHMGMERNRFMRKKVLSEYRHPLTLETPFRIGPFTIEAFHVPHDSADCCGYYITLGAGLPETSFCLATDVGHATADIARYMARAQYVVMESNYDMGMLQAGRYPPFLKARIASGTGHIENEAAADFLAKTLGGAVRRVWLCHLSEENNSPELATAATTRRLSHLTPQPIIEALPRTRPSRLYELGE